MKKILKYVLSILVPVLFVFILYMTCFGIMRVESGSMEPTLKSGETILVNKLAYKTKAPKRGDIIIFYENGDAVTKRVIGMPGEKISFIDGRVFVDGKLLEESYLDETVMTYSSEEFEVPQEYYFVLGDNREDSYDSRYMKSTYLSKSSIVGRVIYKFPDTVISQLQESEQKAK